MKRNDVAETCTEINSVVGLLRLAKHGHVVLNDAHFDTMVKCLLRASAIVRAQDVEEEMT